MLWTVAYTQSLCIYCHIQKISSSEPFNTEMKLNLSYAKCSSLFCFKEQERRISLFDLLSKD